MNRGIITAIFVFLLCVTNVYAANYYVREGGKSSTCTSWFDACDQLSTAVNLAPRGSTIYVAEGTYNGVSFNTAVSGTTVITVKKATASDHGTEAGWSSSYGDGVAEFTDKFTFNTGYWTIDGVTGGGPSAWATGHGFRLNKPSALVKHTFVVFSTADPSHITLRHINIGPDTMGWPGWDTAIYAPGGGGADAPYLTMEYCYVHHMSNIGGFFGGGHQMIQYNLFYMCANQTVAGDVICLGAGNPYELCTGYNTPTAPENHGSTIALRNPSDYTTIRYNVFGNSEGSGQIGFYTRGTYNHIKIYGNIFYNNYPGRGPATNIYHTNGTPQYLKIYNNTFFGPNNVRVLNLYDGTANNEFKNNLIYEVTYDVYITGTTMTYNKNASDRSDRPGLDRSLQYLRSDPFLNKNITYAQFPMLPDFSLRYATQDGEHLKNETVEGVLHTYNTDMLGNTRGADGTWDRGAYEFGGKLSYTAPKQPSGLRTIP